MFKRFARQQARFVPPWARSGDATEEAYYRGVPRSRDDVEQTISAIRTSSAIDAGDSVTAPQQFMPYGAVAQQVCPKTGLPAWGMYMQALGTASPPKDTELSNAAQAAGVASSTRYSGDMAMSLLSNDYNMKLPFKYAPEDLKTRSGEWPLGGSVGVVLDIDGVVFSGGATIDGSDVAIQHMIEMKIPFVFMTNGGGHTEAERASRLSKRLGCTIHPSQVILSHSPIQYLAESYKDRPVLIVGPHPTAVETAKSYGFNMAVGSFELQVAYPELVPMRYWPPSMQNLIKANRQRREKIIADLAKEGKFAGYPQFDAVFFVGEHDFDAINDIQIIIDVITAPHGQIGRQASKFQTVPLHMTADDLLWPTKAPLPRLGQGVMREMIASVFESVTGEQLQVVQYGKPRRINYSHAERVLRAESARLGWNPANLRATCMVGDNMETDIIGANAALGKWLSVHVLSGIGSAPSAVRTVSLFDEEAQWQQEHVTKVPDYVAPTLDHFVRELEHFGEAVVTMHRDIKLSKSVSWPPCPAELESVYKLPPLST